MRFLYKELTNFASLQESLTLRLNRLELLKGGVKYILGYFGNPA